MKIEEHYKALKESIEAIERSVEKGLVDNQRTIGLHSSAAAIDLLEIYFHKNSLIDPGFVVKHEWFLSQKILNQKFPFDFDNKSEILKLIMNIEAKRNILCYGKRQKEEFIEDVIINFNKLKKMIKEVGVDEEI